VKVSEDVTNKSMRDWISKLNHMKKNRKMNVEIMKIENGNRKMLSIEMVILSLEMAKYGNDVEYWENV
jgi:hypothetical protein